MASSSPPTPATTATAQPRQGNLQFMVRALGSPNYRLFFGGQSISLIGSWMTRIATSWLVYRLTGSEVLLGIVGFSGQIPSFLLGPYAGVLVDRWNKHRLLVVTQTLAMLQSFGLTILAFSDTRLPHSTTIAWLIGLSAAQGIINAFDMPGRQSFVVEMVENKADLSNAIALNSSMVNMARLIGPALGGVIIAAVGEGYCFLIDGISYMAVIASLLAMTLAARPVAGRRRHNTWSQLREGWAYASGFAPIRTILLLLALVSLMGVPYSVLMPVFADKLRPHDPHVLGYLMAASGVGALIGALFLASRRSVLGLGRIIPIASTVFGLGLITFSLSHVMWLSLLLLMVAGGGFMVQMASSNTLLQTIVQDDKRGRVMSFYTMSFMGTAPFGSLLAGFLAARIGAPHTVLFGGVCCILGAMAFATRLPGLRAAIHPIYREMGIIPELAQGIDEAAELSRPPEE